LINDFNKGDRVKLKDRPYIKGEVLTDPLELAEPVKFYLVDTGRSITLYGADELIPDRSRKRKKTKPE